MALLGSVSLILLFFGFPFYWGAFGHPSVALPLLWALVLALALNWRKVHQHESATLAALFGTLLVSLATSSLAFELGHLLSR